MDCRGIQVLSGTVCWSQDGRGKLGGDPWKSSGTQSSAGARGCSLSVSPANVDQPSPPGAACISAASITPSFLETWSPMMVVRSALARPVPPTPTSAPWAYMATHARFVDMQPPDAGSSYRGLTNWPRFGYNLLSKLAHFSHSQDDTRASVPRPFAPFQAIFPGRPMPKWCSSRPICKRARFSSRCLSQGLNESRRRIMGPPPLQTPPVLLSSATASHARRHALSATLCHPPTYSFGDIRLCCGNISISWNWR